MAGGKRRHFFWIGFASLGVRLGCNQLVVEILRSLERKYRQVDHRRPPLFAIGEPEQKPQAADHIRPVGSIWIAAAKREPPGHGYASRLKEDGLGEPRSSAVALEITADADAFGMIAPKTGMDSAGSLKCIDESRGRQRIRAEPAAQIEKCSCNAQDNNCNAHQSSEGRWFFRGRGRVTRQLFAPMPLQVNLFLKPHRDFRPADKIQLVPSTCNVWDVGHG